MDVEILSNLRIECKVFFNHLILRDTRGRNFNEKISFKQKMSRGAIYVFHVPMFSFDRYFLDCLKSV